MWIQQIWKIFVESYSVPGEVVSRDGQVPRPSSCSARARWWAVPRLLRTVLEAQLVGVRRWPGRVR